MENSFEKLRLDLEKGLISYKDLSPEEIKKIGEYYIQEIKNNKKEIQETRKKIRELEDKINNVN